MIGQFLPEIHTLLIDKGASKAVQKIDEELVKKLKILSKYPFIGSITQKRDARKLILAKHYWVIYKEHDNSIIIAAIIDTRSNHIY